MRKFTFLIIVASITTALSYGQNGSKVTLVKGQKFVIENKLNTVINQEMMGNKMEIVVNVTSNSSIEVKDSKDKNYNLSTSITRLNLATTVMGQELNYDSDKKEDRDSEMGKQLNKSVNSPVDIEISDNGKVVTKQEAKSDKEDASKNPMGAMIGNVGDPKGVAEMAFLVIPSGIKPGSSWNDSTVNESGKTFTTYTLREIKGTDAFIDTKGSMQNTTRQEAMGSEMTTTMTGTIVGESIVDLNTGIVKNQSVTVNATGTTEAMGQQIPMTTIVTSKSTIVPAK